MQAFTVFIGLTVGTALYQVFTGEPNWSSVACSSFDYATALIAYTLLTSIG